MKSKVLKLPTRAHPWCKVNKIKNNSSKKKLKKKKEKRNKKNTFKIDILSILKGYNVIY